MRTSGILMHISSLPSDYGIGTLGHEAYRFIDFLKETGQRYWQVLPVHPTGYGDSPYQTPSAFAGNPYFIDLDILVQDGLLKKNEISNYFFGSDDRTIDYYRLFQNRYPILRTAFQRFCKTGDYYAFIEKNTFWLDEFALFMALKEENHYRSWIYWDEPLKNHEKQAVESAREKLSYTIDFYKFIQYEFFSQWNQLKQYAASKGICLIGDMPIYVALDSAEVWSMPHLFLLDEAHLPVRVAGCPPDAFSEKGQLWGNPLYRWDVMEREKYHWWIERLRMSEELYDRVRIDHFRGFESFYTIEYGAKDAVNGVWEKGPGMKLFERIRTELGNADIIAEDLGYLTPEVLALLKGSGYPGMKVLQFAFDPYGDNRYLPHHHIPECILYTGTHDNDTTRGWYESLDKKEKAFVDSYLRIQSKEEAADAVVCAALASVAETVVIPIQDYLGLGSEARMNTPSTLGENWQFRIKKNDLNHDLKGKIQKMTRTYRRWNK